MKKKYFSPIFMVKTFVNDIITMSGGAFDDGNDNIVGGSGNELDLGGL
ncbi:MAG: hypothetical protein J6Y43_00440 [Clostridia bacterium]|nr:hypothetical protein [Clostridia bacterium]